MSSSAWNISPTASLKSCSISSSMISGERWPPQPEHIRGCGSGCFVERKTDPSPARCHSPSVQCPLEEPHPDRSEEHTSELQSLMRISYAVFCLKKKKTIPPNQQLHMSNNNVHR